NETSKLIGQLKREKKDASEVLKSVSTLGDKIQELDEELRVIDQKIEDYLLITPNILHESVPIGKDENDNLILRTFMEPTKFDFTPRAHFELGENLDILDFERASKVTGSRFFIYKGLGARLERAL